MDYLLSDEPFDEAKCRCLIDRRVKASPDEGMDAVHGYHILEEQKFKMTHAKAHMDFINKSIDEIEVELFLRSRQYDAQIKRIAAVTEITELSALFILSEIGADMSVFESDRRLCSRAGLIPANNESATKKKSTRCSKAGQYLKPLLIQCALAAVKSKKEPYFAIKYQRLSKKPFSTKGGKYAQNSGYGFTLNPPPPATQVPAAIRLLPRALSAFRAPG